MDAGCLLPGDEFAEIAPHDYATLIPADQAKLKTVTLKQRLGGCGTTPGSVHLATSRGDWCIPSCAPVTLVE